MATGPENSQSKSKTLRMPHALVDRIKDIEKREFRKSFSNTLLAIIEDHIDEYERKMRDRVEDKAEQAEEVKDADQDVEEIKGKLLIGKKPKDPAS